MPCVFSPQKLTQTKNNVQRVFARHVSLLCRNDRASGRAVLLSVCLFRIRNREPGLSREDGLHCTAESASPWSTGGWVLGCLHCHPGSPSSRGLPWRCRHLGSLHSAMATPVQGRSQALVCCGAKKPTQRRMDSSSLTQNERNQLGFLNAKVQQRITGQTRYSSQHSKPYIQLTSCALLSQHVNAPQNQSRFVQVGGHRFRLPHSKQHLSAPHHHLSTNPVFSEPHPPLIPFAPPRTSHPRPSAW